MEKSGQSRRRFLQALSGGGLLVLLWRYLVPPADASPPRLIVPRRDLPAEGALVFRQSRVALIREGEVIYALDLSCTHLGCTVNVAPDALVCPCHGSRFDRRGEVLEGPADRPLTRLVVEERGDELVVRA